MFFDAERLIQVVSSNRSHNRSHLAIWPVIFAAASGVIVAAAVQRWKHVQNRQHLRVSKKLRDIQSVLSDCHRKINEIETHLPASLIPGLIQGVSLRPNGTTALGPS